MPTWNTSINWTKPLTRRAALRGAGAVLPRLETSIAASYSWCFHLRITPMRRSRSSSTIEYLQRKRFGKLGKNMEIAIDDSRSSPTL